MTERELTELARQGDLEAYGTLLEKHLPYLINVGRKRLKGRHLVQDMVQEAAILGQKYVPKKLLPGASFRAFMHKLVWFRCQTYIRKRGKEIETGFQDGDFFETEASSDNASRRTSENRDLCEHLLSELDERTRNVVVMYSEGYTHNEIAASLGIGTQTSRNTLWKLRRRLKDRSEFL